MNSVLVAGYFDPPHAGHLEMFEFAKNCVKDAHVIVVIHSVQDIINKNGFYIYTPYELTEILKGFKHCIDEVVMCMDIDGSVTQTLKFLKPDYFVKGPDRNQNNMPKSELEVCNEIGCKVIYQSGSKLSSSSDIKKRIRDQFSNTA
jgi:cytidyltransferase-like protein